MKKGFTLIELLVVIAIIGLLATFAVVQLNSAASKARDARRRSDMRAMQKALEIYFNDNGSYPNNGGAAWWGNCVNGGSHPLTGATGYIPGLAPTYMPVLPADPKPMAHPELLAGCTVAASCYLYRSNGVGYRLLSHCNIESGSIGTADPMADTIYPNYALGICSPPGSAACSWP